MSKERRRRQIIDAAKVEFAERGYHEASIADIIDRAGIARGTFYLYFTNKHRVFEAILDHALAELRERIQPIDITPGAASPRRQLRDNMLRVVGFLVGDPPLARMLFDYRAAPVVEAAARVDAFYAQVRELIAASLQHGIAMGLVRTCPVELVAAAVIGAVRGVVGRLLEAPPAEADVEAAVDELVEFGLRGVLITDGRG